MAVTGTNAATNTENSGDELCYKIVSAVAERRGIDVADVEERLNDVVDVDALDRLLGRRAAGTERTVSLSLAGVELLVTADRAVLVTGVAE